MTALKKKGSERLHVTLQFGAADPRSSCSVLVKADCNRTLQGRDTQSLILQQPLQQLTRGAHTNAKTDGSRVHKNNTHSCSTATIHQNTPAANIQKTNKHKNPFHAHTCLLAHTNLSMLRVCGGISSTCTELDHWSGLVWSELTDSQHRWSWSHRETSTKVCSWGLGRKIQDFSCSSDGSGGNLFSLQTAVCWSVSLYLSCYVNVTVLSPVRSKIQFI